MDINDLRTLAGVEPVKRNSQKTFLELLGEYEAKDKAIKEADISTARTGPFKKFWIVINPLSSYDVSHDCLIEVTELNQFVHWIHTFQKDKTVEKVHEAFENAQFFHDKFSAHTEANTRLVKIRSEKLKDNKKDDKDLKQNTIKQDTVDDVEENEEEITSSDSFQRKEDIEAFGESKDPKIDVLKFKREDIGFADKREKDFYGAGVSDQDDVEEPVVVKVPQKLKTQLKDKITQLSNDFQSATLHDENSTKFYPAMLKKLISLYDALETKDMKSIQIELDTMSSIYLHEVPDDLIKFIKLGGKLPSLQTMFYELKSGKK